MESAAVRILALLGLTPLRSTGSVLTCRASGGPKGGTVEFTLSDGSRLAKSGGSFPYTKELAPGEEMSFEIACTGQGESGGEDDIVVTGTFLQDVEWRNVGNGHFSSSEEYICSLDADENPIEVRYRNRGHPTNPFSAMSPHG